MATGAACRIAIPRQTISRLYGLNFDCVTSNNAFNCTKLTAKSSNSHPQFSVHGLHLDPQPNVFLIFGRLVYFFGGFSASRIFSGGFSASVFFSANPAEIRRLRPATTTKGYFYYKDGPYTAYADTVIPPIYCIGYFSV